MIITEIGRQSFTLKETANGGDVLLEIPKNHLEYMNRNKVINLNMLQNISESKSPGQVLKKYITCPYSKTLTFFRTTENGRNCSHFVKITPHNIAQSCFYLAQSINDIKSNSHIS